MLRDCQCLSLAVVYERGVLGVRFDFGRCESNVFKHQARARHYVIINRKPNTTFIVLVNEESLAAEGS